MAFDTTSELALLTEKEIGHNLGSAASSQRADVLAHLNDANRIIHDGGGILNYDESNRRKRNDVVFSFARSQNPIALTLRPAITTVNVTATRGSNAITFDAAPDGSNSLAGWFLRVGSEDELYQLSSHTGGATAAVIDGDYVGPSNVTANSCTLVKLQYDIGANTISQLVSPIRVYSKESSEQRIDIVDKDELIKQSPRSLMIARFPRYCTIVKSSAGTLTIELDSYPEDYERIEFEYIPIPSTLDTSSVNPVIPSQYRKVLAYLAAHYLCMRNNDNRSGAFLQMARDLFDQLVKWNEKMYSVGDVNVGRVIIRGFSNPPLIKVQRGYVLAG